MKLSELYPAVEAMAVDPELTGLTGDSRTVRPGDLFLASATTPGGHIRQAVAQGAAAVIWDAAVEEAVALPPEVAGFPVANLVDRQGELADRFFGSPSHQLQVVGVTGTNGKSSVCHFLAQALDRCGVIGTLGHGFIDALEPTTHTTPDAVEFHHLLSEAAGAEQVATEVSSHALTQGRVGGVHFACAVFTNLGRDHLDYHGDMVRYGAAKQTLFRWPGLQGAVVNLDDPFGRELAQQLPQELPLLGYGSEVLPGVESLHAEELQLTSTGITFTLVNGSERGQLQVPLLGVFNVSNLLAVAAVLRQLGLSFQELLTRLQQIRAVPGRMERLVKAAAVGPTVVLDYAHNPDGLEQVLSGLRRHMNGCGSGGRLICLFGCGGERDRGKRPLMGALAGELADHIVLTSDNPRGEDAEAILDEIAQGLGPTTTAERITDRAAAIAHAIGSARAEDWVLVAGKGDEREQLVGTRRIPFCDRVEIRRALDGWS